MGISKRHFEDVRVTDELTSRQNRLLKIPNVDISKEGIEQEIKRMVGAIDNGEVDPLKAIAYFAAVDKVLKEVRSKIMEYGLDEFAKYGEREITVMGNCHLSQMETGTRYDFKNTPAWCEIKERENEIAEERKQFEATLKTLKGPGAMTTEDGELIDINPPIKSSSTVIKVVIK